MKDTDDIRRRLFALGDEKYRAFQGALIPGIPPEMIIGVRMPMIRSLAKELALCREAAGRFLSTLPHDYYDENMLHSVLVSAERSPQRCFELLDGFLPYVDNWAVCDALRPKCFDGVKKGDDRELADRLSRMVAKWIVSDRTYTVRFAMGVLTAYYLDESFDISQPKLVASAMKSSPRSEEYYVRMMAAWYFATALAKQYDTAITFIERRALDPWTHRKAIQKAIESYRVTPEHKEYLRSLR